MADHVAALNDAWAQWWAFLKENPDWLTDREHCSRVHRRLARFSDLHPNTPRHVDAVLATLGKGKHLVEAALRWTEPVAGPRPEGEATRTDRARGEQWRLVMAHGGLEPVVKALLVVREPYRYVSDAAREAFLKCCDLPPFEPLAPPSRDRAALKRWLDVDENEGRPLLFGFLELNADDERIIRTWLVEGQPIAAWPAALQLATALRNATAHGALSPSKVDDLGLREAFRVLTDDLGTVVTGAFRRLAEPEKASGTSQAVARGA